MPPAAPSTIETIDVDDPTGDDGAPSRLALLQRAAELGPGPRATLHSMFMAPTDPVLAEKREPRVIERRARFRRVVKVALGLCAGFCLFATAATAFSSSRATEGASPSTVSHGTAPASVVSEKQTLEVANTTKAERSSVVATPAAAPRRTAKRR